MIIQLQDVSYKYPTATMRGEGKDNWSLVHINLSIQEGELLVITGANGSGKTTLCLTMNGLVPHFFKGKLVGKVVVLGKDIQKVEVTDMVTEVSMVFQNPFDQLTGAADTVYGEVAIGPENMGLPREETHRRVKQALEDAGITHLAERHPLQLSGGQQQRVALAAVLTMRPKILVFDEPTSQLDPVGTEEVMNVIKRLHKQGMTIILAEHKIDEVAELADRILVLKEGRIVKLGSPREILTSPDLRDFGIYSPQPTQLAINLREKGLWDHELPLTMKEIEIGIREIIK